MKNKAPGWPRFKPLQELTENDVDRLADYMTGSLGVQFGPASSREFIVRQEKVSTRSYETSTSGGSSLHQLRCYFDPCRKSVVAAFEVSDPSSVDHAKKALSIFITRHINEWTLRVVIESKYTAIMSKGPVEIKESTPPEILNAVEQILGHFSRDKRRFRLDGYELHLSWQEANQLIKWIVELHKHDF